MPRPMYIDTPGATVFAVFHEPAADSVDGLPAVLFCSPWGWNETVSYHSRRTWAESLAADGHPVLRFDLPAVGDSEGRPEDSDLVSRWTDSVVAVSTRLGELAPGRELVVLGMELGGLLALEAARRGAPVDAVALWAIPKDGRGFVRTVKAFSRMQRWGGGPTGDSPLAEDWIEAAGFVLSSETAEDLRELKPSSTDPPARLTRALVFGRDEIEPEVGLVDHLASAGVAVESAPGPGWDEMVLHPGYTVPPPLVMRAFADWLRNGRRDGVDATPRVEVATTLWSDGEPWRESVISDLPTDTFGIQSDPDVDRREEVVVVFLNAGAVRHIGPNRIWVDASRELAGSGIRTVRIDLAGIGEADGRSARFAEVAEFYAPEFGAQIRAVLDSLERQGTGRRFVVVGLCSGGYWSFRTALEDERVVKVILLNAGALRWRDSLIMEQHGKGLGLLLERRLWKKFLSGGFDLGKVRAFLDLAARSLIRKLRRVLWTVRHPASHGGPPERSVDIEGDLDALRDAGTPVVLAFSQDEMTEDELRRLGIFDQRDRWPTLDVVELPGVDHALASTSAQDAARRLLRAEVVEDADPSPAVTPTQSA